MKSLDGLQWTLCETNQTDRLYNPLFANDQYVAFYAMWGQPSRFFTSSDGCIWTQTSSLDRQISSVAWNGRLFVAVGAEGGIYTSEDLTNWERRESGKTSWLEKVTYGNGLFVVASQDGSILTSPDGNSWTAHLTGAAQGLNPFWQGGQFVALCKSDIFTSTDGTSWEQRTPDGIRDKDWYSAVWDGSRFLAISIGGSLAESTDGAQWLSLSSIAPLVVHHMLWDGERYVAVGRGGGPSVPYGAIASSKDGTQWTAQVVFENTEAIACVGTNGEVLVAVGQGGIIVTSADGLTWEKQDSRTTNWLAGIAWCGTQFVAVGAGATVLTSPDGFCWTVQDMGTTDPFVYLDRVAWDGTTCVVVGHWRDYYSFILRSSDAVHWQWMTLQLTFLTNVAWTGSRFIATGPGAVVLTSPNGSEWLSESLPTVQSINAVAASACDTVLVGDDAVIFRCHVPPPSITSTKKRTSPFKLRITGSDFQSGCRVFIGSNTEPWPNTSYKSPSSIVLEGGSALKRLFPKGVSVPIKVVNPDGQDATAVFTR